jgi:phosphopantothenoylcysteine synthetase/decarboxylase
MKVILTCGPAYEPVDDVRRITNFSTGELGTVLSERLAAAGARVICLRGAAATHPSLPSHAEVRTFTTNDDLVGKLTRLAQEGPVAAVFHAAALCDYRVSRVTTADGREAAGAKIASRDGSLMITLEPATKVIRSLRGLFPASRIVGWKYELDGSQADATAKGSRQIAENGTDACVVNGRAYGEGFGFLRPSGEIVHLADKAELCDFLATWMSRGQGKQGTEASRHAA